MKRAISIFVIFLILPLTPSSLAQIYNSDFSHQQKQSIFRNNKVWMVYSWTYRYMNGVQEKKGNKTSFERFDHNGNRVEEHNYDFSGNTVFSCEFSYDDKGNEIKKMGAEADEVIYEKWKYSNMNDNRIEKRSEYRKAKEQKWILSMDEKQNVLEEMYYDATGTLSYKIEYVYDKNEKLTNKIQYDPYDNIYRKWDYKYDDRGNNTEMNIYTSGNQLFRSYRMHYDKKGNMKSKFTLDKDDKVIELSIYVYQFYDGLHAPRTIGTKEF